MKCFYKILCISFEYLCATSIKNFSKSVDILIVLDTQYWTFSPIIYSQNNTMANRPVFLSTVTYL